MHPFILAAAILASSQDASVTSTPPDVDCDARHHALYESAKFVIERTSNRDAPVDTDPDTLQVFVIQGLPAKENHASDDGQAIYVSKDAFEGPGADANVIARLQAQAIDKRLVLATGNACPAPSEPRPIYLFQDRAMTEQIARAVFETVFKASQRWNPEDVWPLVFPGFDKASILKGGLAHGAAKLGKVKTCVSDSLSNEGNPVPNSIQYKGTCEFEHGKGHAFMLFGFPKDGTGYVLFGLDIYPIDQ